MKDLANTPGAGERDRPEPEQAAEQALVDGDRLHLPAHDLGVGGVGTPTAHR